MSTAVDNTDGKHIGLRGLDLTISGRHSRQRRIDDTGSVVAAWRGSLIAVLRAGLGPLEFDMPIAQSLGQPVERRARIGIALRALDALLRIGEKLRQLCFAVEYRPFEIGIFGQKNFACLRK